jgi:hypothetical protein
MSESVQQGWLDFASAMQAHLSRNGNKGYAKVTVTLVVKELDVQLWEEPDIARLSPLRISKGGMTSEVAMMLMAATNGKVHARVKGVDKDDKIS